MAKRRNYISNFDFQASTHNERYSIAKPYFSTVTKHQKITSIKIKEMLGILDEYLKKYSLKLAKVKIVERQQNQQENNFLIKIVKCLNIDDTMNEKLFFFTLMAKDLTYLSDKNYNNLRSIFKMDTPFHRFLALRKKMDLMFRKIVKGNIKGFYIPFEKRLKFVLPFVIKEKKIQENETITIKIAADGVNLTQKHTGVFNVTFTVINERKKAITSSGNYLLGINLIFLNK